MRGIVGVVLLCVLLAGCGGAAPQAGTGASVETIFGTVEVPAAPQRVVALGWGDAEAALALGVQPVGASDWLAHGGEGVGPWAAGLYTTPPQNLGTQQVDLEAVAALRPDVILWTRSSNERELYDKLSRIAPTVAAPPGVTTAYSTLFDQQARSVAAALGRQADGEKLVADVEQRFAEVRDAHPQWRGRQVAVGVYNQNTFAAYVRGGLRADFMEDLGFTLKPGLEDLPAQSFSANLGTENVAALDADLTVVFLIGASADQVRDNPLVQRLSSTRAGHLLVLDDHAISKAFSSGTALGVRYSIDRVVPLVEQAQV